MGRLAGEGVARIVREAAGGYERACALALCEAGLPVVVVNPRQARAYARASGRLAKTDRVDALALARFAKAVEAEPRDLGTPARRELAALVGVAPMNRGSGENRGYRRTLGGRARVRRVLSMAALTASRRDPGLRPSYRRLRAAGERGEIALTAVMRKLLVGLDAMLASDQAWHPQPTNGSPWTTDTVAHSPAGSSLPVTSKRNSTTSSARRKNRVGRAMP